MSSERLLPTSIFLADDDADDCTFFAEALKDLDIETELTISNDGIELMSNLEKVLDPPPPDVIFLDLNMPLKNGFECLEEIREHPKLKEIPVVIFSTSANKESIEKSYTKGANYFIRKPNTHGDLKELITMVLDIDLWEQNQRTPRNQFLLKL